MALQIVIGDRNYSSWSMRGWLPLAQVAAKTGVAFSEVLIRLDQANTASSIAQYSPTGKIPCLIDGETLVWDTMAIAEYLAESYPSVPLWPTAQAARARARSIVAEMHSGFTSLRSACPMNIKLDMPSFKPSPEVQADLARIDALWRDCRNQFATGGPYLFGAEAGIADWFFAPVVMRINSYHLPLSPEGLDYCRALSHHPLVAQWITAARAENWEIGRYRI
ncbi:MAG: glutathione S-transferase family protein [Candidatus Pacebacteria bacterium]|nr:glutathione S-transferase family protein [Candidatus Paceibacterota bacterium]